MVEASRSIPTLSNFSLPPSLKDLWSAILVPRPPSVLPPQLAPPTIRSILQDTGLPGDGVTADRRPALLGTAPSRAVVEIFRNTEWIGRTTAAADGSWRFTTAKPLADGAYTFTARATQACYRPSQFSKAFVVQVDTTPPAAPLLSLTLSSDTGLIGDSQTQLQRVVLKGTTEARATVALQGQGRQVRASSDGSFTFWDVPLKPGVNVFTVKTTDLAGNTTTSCLRLTRLPQAEPAPDPVLSWHQTLLEAIRVDRLAPTTATRAMAMESLAVFDTLAAIDGTPGYLVRLPAPSGIHPGLAAG